LSEKKKKKQIKKFKISKKKKKKPSMNNKLPPAGVKAKPAATPGIETLSVKSSSKCSGYFLFFLKKIIYFPFKENKR